MVCGRWRGAHRPPPWWALLPRLPGADMIGLTSVPTIAEWWESDSALSTVRARQSVHVRVRCVQAAVAGARVRSAPTNTPLDHGLHAAWSRARVATMRRPAAFDLWAIASPDNIPDARLRRLAERHFPET